jgi:hypothetical protein
MKGDFAKIQAPLTPGERLRQSLYRGLLRFPFWPEPTPYYMTFCAKPAFVWYRVAKCATHSIFGHLIQHKVDFTSTQSAQLHYAPLRYPAHFKFAFVRNPWDRLVSCWHNKVIDKQKRNFGDRLEAFKEFGNFVDYVAEQNLETCNKHYRLQCRLIDLNRVDFLGRLERFPEDFRIVCDKLGLPGEPRKVNVSGRQRDYRLYYSDALAEKVGTLYRRDITLFGYTFDPRGDTAPGPGGLTP